ncbi:Tripartite motif-containing protein 29 [Dissostichus eleginoides]|uniref:Tripartite motif-containing protein 29 n=1 Tax=Dissostichus eleginoides TaxID=100907 RepID=A0AAD9F2E0_DISEL|nr:Tripartite motif-containing protein 29 [Dissostichus eleginoides]
MSDNLLKNQKVILCDMCTEDRKPARKTCMKCEISMCVQHLQTHLTSPVLLQTHPLTEPLALGLAGLSTTKCPQHGKLLEYYCLDDLTCVCVSCAIEDQHRLHNMKTFSTAHKELMEKLNAEQQASLVKTNEDYVNLGKWEKSEREKLGRSSLRLVEAVTSLRDIALTSVQSSFSSRMVAIKTSKSSMQEAQKEKDTFRFLQMYSQVHQDLEKAKAVDLRKGLEPGSDRDKLVQEIRENGEEIVKQAGHLWGSLLTLVDPENHQELIATGSDLIFDQNNPGPGMSLSEDKKKVFYSNWLGGSSACMFPIQGIQSGHSFEGWVTSLSKHCDWTIGLCDTNYAKELRDGEVYALCCKGNQLSFLTTQYSERITAFSLRHTHMNMRRRTENALRVFSQAIDPSGNNITNPLAWPQKVEVVFSFPDLTFFSVSQYQRRKIVTITMSHESWRLTPFVCLEVEESQKVLKHLRTSTHAAGYLSPRQHSQKQWRCSCGRLYNETGDAYNYDGNIYQKSSKATCVCREVIGPPHITEMLCELL